MPTSADLLFDTSAAIALVTKSHPAHRDVLDASREQKRGLAGHALMETYSVLTRLPGSQRLGAAAAQRVIQRAFPESVALPEEVALHAVDTLAAVGIAGGAVYDGLVGLASFAANRPLLSIDNRAARTYRALGVDVRLL